MQLNKTEFLKHLERTEKCLPGKTSFQTMNNILFKYGEAYQLEANDLETFLSTGEPGAEGELLLPPKIINIVKNLPKEEIELNIEENKVQLKSGKSKFNIQAMSAEDYPRVDIQKLDKTFTFEGYELKNIIRKTIFAASKDESRPVFTGVLFEFGDSLKVATSDTYRLAMQEVDYTGEGTYIVPARSLAKLNGLIKDNDTVEMYPANNQIVFEFGEVVFAARLLDEQYPDVSGVIPSESKTTVQVGREQLRDTLGRAALLADHTEAVHINIGESMSVKVSSEYGEMSEEIEPVIEGEEIDVYLNVRFLLDALKVIQEGTVEIHFAGPQAPVIMRGQVDENYLYLVLPIKRE